MGDTPTSPSHNLATVNDEVNHRWNPYVTSLNNQLTTINSDAFAHAKYVTKLTISNNIIKVVKSRDFVQLSRLRYLDIHSNQIKFLSPNSFYGLYALERLRLSDNNIITLSDQLFKSTPRIRNLNLDNNEIEYLSRNIMSKLSQLSVLDVSNNKLTGMHPDVFRYNNKLMELLFSGNSLRAVSSAWFRSLRYLQKLNLDDNGLVSLRSDNFRGLTSLKRLSLKANKLGNIDRHAFRGLYNLKMLDLSDNVISKLGFFSDLPRLIDLNLATNRIRSVGSRSLRFLTNLVSLKLSDNDISEVLNSEISSLKSLRKLDVSDNDLTFIKNGTFVDLVELRELDLSNNEISLLVRSCFSVARMKSLSKITWLNLQHNRLTSLDIGVLSGMPHLKFLSVSNNLLTEINPNAFHLLRNLRTLSLNSNKLPYVDNVLFKRLKQLRHLNLADNQLSSLKMAMFKGLKSLQELDVSSNRIASLYYRVFTDIPYLNNLNISNNLLKSFNFSLMTSLKYLADLDLSKNDVTSLNIGDYKHKLNLLSLTENRLTSLDENVTDIIRSNGKLDIGLNPWLCDCKLLWLPKLKTTTITMVTSGNVVCKYPKHLAGRKILDMKPSDFSCEESHVKQGKKYDDKTFKPSKSYKPTAIDNYREYTLKPSQSTTVTPKPTTSTIITSPPTTRTRTTTTATPTTSTPTTTTTTTTTTTPQTPTTTSKIITTKKESWKTFPKIKDKLKKSRISNEILLPDETYAKQSTTQTMTKSPQTTQKTLTPIPKTHTEITSSPKVSMKTECKMPIHASTGNFIRQHKKETKNYHVTISGRNRKSICNGVLLSSKWFVTSASCVHRHVASLYTDRLKQEVRLRVKIGERELNTAVLVVLPQSRDGPAFLKLKYDSLMMYVVPPMCLFTQKRTDNWVYGAMATRIVDRKKSRGRHRQFLLKLRSDLCAKSDCLFRFAGRYGGSIDGAGVFMRSKTNTWGLVGLSSFNHRGQVRFIHLGEYLAWCDRLIYGQIST